MRVYEIQLEFRSVGFCGGRKTGESSEKQATNSTFIWRWVRGANPGHIGGRQVPFNHCSSPYVIIVLRNFEIAAWIRMDNFFSPENITRSVVTKQRPNEKGRWLKPGQYVNFSIKYNYALLIYLCTEQQLTTNPVNCQSVNMSLFLSFFFIYSFFLSFCLSFYLFFYIFSTCF